MTSDNVGLQLDMNNAYVGCFHYMCLRKLVNEALDGFIFGHIESKAAH